QEGDKEADGEEGHGQEVEVGLWLCSRHERMWVCGDHRDTGSIQGSLVSGRHGRLVSGRRAADDLLAAAG
ncbi:MAG: hypothetical protein WD358_02150, partial [Nitriliruptoraceae bacterium]